MNKLKQNRAASFVAVTLVYIIATVVGVLAYLVAGAVANTILFFAVSIPMADKRQSRKDGFAEYKKQTRMLLPIKK